jgi:hypothetical protein
MRKIKTLTGKDITVQRVYGGGLIDGTIWLRLIDGHAKVIDKDTDEAEIMATYLTQEQTRELITALEEALQALEKP